METRGGKAHKKLELNGPWVRDPYSIMIEQHMLNPRGGMSYKTSFKL